MVAVPRLQEVDVSADPYDYDPGRAEGMRSRLDDGFEEVERHWVLTKHAVWHERQAFYRGWQWGIATPDGWMAAEDIVEGEAFCVINMMRKVARTSASSFLTGQPNPTVIPSHEGIAGVSMAEMSQALLRSLTRANIIPYEEVYLSTLAAQIIGIGFLKCYWDPSIRTPFGEWGEIAAEHLDIFNIFADPHATSRRRSRYLFTRQALPLSSMMDRFPEDMWGRPISPSKWKRPGRAYDTPGQFAEGVYRDSFTSELNELVELVEYWELPTKRYPEGRLVSYSGNVIVYAGPLPFRWPWIPFYGPNWVPRNQFPEGALVDGIPIQRDINFGASKKREWTNVLTPHLMIPEGAGFDEQQWSDIAGEAIVYNPGFMPGFPSYPDVPNSLFADQELQAGQISDVTTVDIQLTSNQQQVPSGRAQAWVDYNKNAVQAPEQAIQRISLASLYTTALSHARDFYQDGRLIQLMGDGDAWRPKLFRRQDFDFDVALDVDPYSPAPMTQAVKDAQTMELAQQGLLSDTPEGERARDLMRMKTMESSTWDAKQKARRQAREETMAWLMEPLGFALMVRPFEDHATHAKEHDDFRNSDDYKNLSPMLQQQMDQHVVEHELWLVDQEQAQAMQQAASQNPSIGPGGGAPPEKHGVESPIDGGAPTDPMAPHGQGEPPTME